MDIKQARYLRVSRSVPVSLPPVQRCRRHKPAGSQSSRLSPSSSTLSSSLHLFLLLDDFLRIFKTLFTLFIWSPSHRKGTGSPRLLLSQQLQLPGKEGQLEAGRSLGGTKALVCVCMRVSVSKASFHPKIEFWVVAGRGKEREGFLLPLSIHSSCRQQEQAFLLPDDLGKLVTHRGSRSCIGFSISVFNNTCILADFKCSSGKRVSISSEKAVTLKEFWLHFKD